MSTEKNKATANRFTEEVLNKKNLSLLNEFIDANCITHATVGDFKGPEGFKQFVSSYFAAFPDMRVVNEEVLAEGDKVVFRQTVYGTNTGSMMGIPPTGKKFAIQEMVINRFVDGKIVESWALADLFDMMQQLGLVPPMGQK
jgi:predicted ester cyclase